MIFIISRGNAIILNKLCKHFLATESWNLGRNSVDKTLISVLQENDLKEKFIKGSGPGGSKVNKSINCVQLFHKPTGLQVKVHESRELNSNRKIAREKLTKMLDNLQNGELSVENQQKNLLNQKSRKRIQKQKKLLEKKREWKESLKPPEKDCSEF